MIVDLFVCLEWYWIDWIYRERERNMIYKRSTNFKYKSSTQIITHFYGTHHTQTLFVWHRTRSTVHKTFPFQQNSLNLLLCLKQQQKIQSNQWSDLSFLANIKPVCTNFDTHHFSRRTFDLTAFYVYISSLFVCDFVLVSKNLVDDNYRRDQQL